MIVRRDCKHFHRARLSSKPEKHGCTQIHARRHSLILFRWPEDSNFSFQFKFLGLPWKPPGRVFAPSSSVIPMQDRDLQPQCGVQVASSHAYRMCIAESNRRAKLVTFAETFPWILRSYVLHIFPPYISKIKLCFFWGGFGELNTMPASLLWSVAG